MISNVVDLNGRCVVVVHSCDEHVLEAGRCRDQNDFVAVNDFVVDSVSNTRLHELDERK